MNNVSVKNVAVVGCGIIGLTSAIRLLEEGFRVRVVAKDIPPCTTSNKAAAIWEPYKVKPEKDAAEWAWSSYRRYTSEYDEPRAGVREVELMAVSKAGDLADPFWLRNEYPFRRLAKLELPDGCKDGYAVKVPFIHSATYLAYLLRRLAQLGGDLEIRDLPSLTELDSGFDAIVNCSGLGARQLVSDPEVHPIRGQLAVVALDRPARYIVEASDPDAPTYVFPRGDECILGGTATVGDFDLNEDRATRASILQRCQQLEPAVRGLAFLRPVVGLRPGRKVVRLEMEPNRSNPKVVHNYGHGGAGFTVAWGCAEEVQKLVSGALS